jgi:hypothetical protein
MDVINKRGAPRSRVLKDGKILVAGNWSVVDCTVRDWSATGARLRIHHQMAVPNDFRLMLPSDNSIRDVHVVWRREDDIGVIFTSDAKRAPPRKW